MRLFSQAVQEGTAIEAVDARTPARHGTLDVGGMLLSKYQTLGNSYLVFDPNRSRLGKHSFEPSATWIRTVCDDNYGIGSNGLLVGPDRVDGTSFEFRIFNSDGSQAQLSGNGSRIFARYLIDAGYVVSAITPRFSIVAVSDQARIVIGVRAEPDDDAEIYTRIHVVPSFGPGAVAAREGATVGNGDSFAVAALADIGRRCVRSGSAWSNSTMLSIGNPHCVTFVPSLEMLPSFDALNGFASELSLIADAPLSGLDNPVFRYGCNLQWCFVESRERIHLRIVERGEGPTLASGSSASAAMIAALKRGLIDREALVIMPGGAVPLALSLHNNEIVAVEIVGFVHRIAEISFLARGSKVNDIEPSGLPRDLTG